MGAGHAVKSYLNKGVTIPASQALGEVCRFAIENEGRLNFKVDVYLGKVTSTPLLRLQDSTGYEFWNTVKSGSALSASTDVTVTPDYTTGVLAAVAHGFADAQLIVLNSSGAVPGSLLQGNRYFVRLLTANTFSISTQQTAGSIVTGFTDNGTGTITATAVTLSTLSVNVEVAADQAAMPLRPTGRLVATTTGGQAVQVVDVRIGQVY
jgi:hypothetical protein